jgi:lipopolysaccharide transport system permease protein
MKAVAPADGHSSIIIQPTRGWASLQIGELWEYRDLLYFTVTRDLKARYRQTALGPLWIIIQPLVSMVLYTLVFGVFARLPSDGLPYPLFSFSGLLPWDFFNDAVNSGTTSLFQNRELINKVYFPRLLLPFARTLSSLVDFVVAFVILFLMQVGYSIAGYPIHLSWHIVFVPFFLLIAAMTGLGFGMLFSGAVVKYRDVGNVVGYIVRAWMYLSPVVYASSLVPENLRFWFYLNPMAGVVDGFRWALFGSAPPEWIPFSISVVLAGMLFIFGLFVYKRFERNIVDVA